MYLNRLQIGNFLGIRSAKLDLDDTTVLIGENDSGKTAILEAIEKVLSADKNGGGLQFYQHEFHQQRKGDQYRPIGPIRIALTFRERNMDEWSFLQNNEMGITLPDDKSKFQELTVEVMAYPGDSPAQAEWRISIPGVDTSHLRNDQSVLDWIRRMNPVFRIRGGMLTNVLETPATSSEEQSYGSPSGNLIDTITDHYESLLKGTSPDAHAELKSGYNAAMRYLEDASGMFRPDGYPEQRIIREILGKQHSKASYGEKRVSLHHGSASEMIGMLLFTSAMLQSGTLNADPSSEPIFIIEDPEANLHPMTQESVRILIERLKWQKLITTQSGDFLAGFPITDIRRITRNDGLVRQFRTDAGSLTSEDIRRLSYHIRMRRGSATFARCWLLVEGESEVWLLPHLARLCGFELAMEGISCVEFAQCGLAPLIKTAHQLGIEWHVLADGDAAGKSYIETARHFANEYGDDHTLRFTRLREKDIEHHMYFNGYSGVYQDYSGIPAEVARNMHPGKVIGRAIHRNSKPFMAVAVVEAIAGEGSPGVPFASRKLIETCIRLARGK